MLITKYKSIAINIAKYQSIAILYNTIKPTPVCIFFYFQLIVLWSLSSSNKTLAGKQSVLEFTTQNQNQALDNLSKRHQIIGGDELDA